MKKFLAILFLSLFAFAMSAPADLPDPPPYPDHPPFLPEHPGEGWYWDPISGCWILESRYFGVLMQCVEGDIDTTGMR